MKIKFSISSLRLKSFGKKKEMKLEFRLLDDIVAKSFAAKAGFFDAFTVERLDMTIAISAGIKFSWFNRWVPITCKG